MITFADDIRFISELMTKIDSTDLGYNIADYAQQMHVAISKYVTSVVQLPSDVIPPDMFAGLSGLLRQ